MDRPPGKISLIATSDLSEFTDRVYAHLDKDRFDRQDIEMVRFANNEYMPRAPQTLRRREAFLFHSLHYPEPNISLVQLLLTIDTVARGSADRITLVLPYISYQRQDTKVEPRVPISAPLIADFVQYNPVVRHIITMDMHSKAGQGFYHTNVDNLPGWLVFKPYFRSLFAGDMSNVTFVSPDAGGAARNEKAAESLGVPVNLIAKSRGGPNQVKSMRFAGDADDVRGKYVIMYEDMIDTASSAVKSSDLLYGLGAKKVYLCGTHGIFSVKDGIAAEERLRGSGLEVLITDSIPRSQEYREAHKDWLTVIPLDQLIADSVRENSTVGGSVSKLFDP